MSRCHRKIVAGAMISRIAARRPVGIVPASRLSHARPHRTLNQAAPLRPLPDGATDLDHFRVLRRDRAGGVIHEYRLVA
jgi:putative transposase